MELSKIYSETLLSSCSEFFISEYVEGSSNNKALEIYNGTGVEIDLSKLLLIKASNGGVISSKAYNIINSPNRLTLSTDGEQVGCLPDTLSFNLNIDSTNGIGDNFPLQKYKLDWGDGTATEIYKHCELLSTNGAIRHLYNSTSCSQTSIGFNVQTSLINTFYSTTGILQNCDQPIVTTRAKISKKPVPDFNFISPGCVNTNIIFTNGYYKLNPKNRITI